MPKLMEIYKCEICGNISEMVHGGGGTMVCCGKEMVCLEEKTADMATEKHVPVIEKTQNGYKVTVGSTIHPMTEEHYIEWIELICGDKIQRIHLKPGMEPVANFQLCSKCMDKPVIAREHCNVHGLWKNTQG